jgi:hypothetical protein
MDPLYVDHFLCVQINSHLMMMMTSPDFDVCGVVRELSGLVYFWCVTSEEIVECFCLTKPRQTYCVY